MSSHLVIGEFSRATHLTVKALRHYHEVGLLIPADVDPDSGYRYYAGSQIERAQLIRRLRELEMPLPEVEAVLGAPTIAERDQAVARHLERMENELERTRSVVGSLRELLEAPPETISVEWRHLETARALAMTAVVARPDIEGWCAAAFPTLFQEVMAAGIAPSAPTGALFDSSFFEEGAGTVTAFVPISDARIDPGNCDLIEIPETPIAVAIHAGPYSRLDRTYGALANYVSKSGWGFDAPIREHYLVSVNDTEDPADFRTEVCWPVAGLPED